MSIDTLAAQLKDIFGERLKMVASFGGHTHTCAIVQTLTLDDLDRCAEHGSKWNKLGLEVPLFIVEEELPRALDVFPLELSEIIATRRVVAGTDVLDRRHHSKTGTAARVRSAGTRPCPASA